jgi:hypothetical protein
MSQHLFRKSSGGHSCAYTCYGCGKEVQARVQSPGIPKEVWTRLPAASPSESALLRMLLVYMQDFLRGKVGRINAKNKFMEQYMCLEGYQF